MTFWRATNIFVGSVSCWKDLWALQQGCTFGGLTLACILLFTRTNFKAILRFRQKSRYIKRHDFLLSNNVIATTYSSGGMYRMTGPLVLLSVLDVFFSFFGKIAGAYLCFKLPGKHKPIFLKKTLVAFKNLGKITWQNIRTNIIKQIKTAKAKLSIWLFYGKYFSCRNLSSCWITFGFWLQMTRAKGHVAYYSLWPSRY